ncbi:uncharacterized protein LOC128233612 isoform X3 [Mya arenaria]|uniref:uncharacterized protein LOC128233612 isoform X3 n=1 Tax=Mya arenaria TaxID=6604 RepID=UPI0022E5B118|nr:uncharacterized protein LOC128233612 isoform X3 [Mya arenaria]
MPRQWMLICAQLAVLDSAVFGNNYVARNNYGTISVVGPAFVNREITLKVTQFCPLECDVEWRYIMDNGTTVQTMTGTKVNGSFFLKWTASAKYNRAQFYAECSTNKTIRTEMTTLNMKDIHGQCGALVLLSPVVLGVDVELGYFPSDNLIESKNVIKRKWKKNNHEIQIHEGCCAEKRVTEYSYILTIFNFNKTDEGTYILNCDSGGNTDSVQLKFPEKPSFPVLGPKYPDYNTTECFYVFGGSDFYCKTENGTEPVQVTFLIGQESITLDETKMKRGLYRLQDVHQHMAGQSRQNVTCQVSNAALETPYEVHGILCHVEKGSQPVLTVPERLHGKRSSSICEVRNAFPAPAIEISVDKALQADVQQTDLFNGSSHTFTSTATMTKTNKAWNGKRMCCTTKTKYEFGLGNVSVCKNISMKFSQPHEKDNQTFSSTSRFPLNNILIGTGVLCGLCILFIIGRCVYLKRRKVNEINTIEIVENHRDTSLDNGVLHIETGGVQYAVMQRQAATQRTGTQQPHDGGGLTYAELDIKFLQEANARVPSSKKNNTPTEYADIAFSSTQKSAEENHVYHNTSA